MILCQVTLLSLTSFPLMFGIPYPRSCSTHRPGVQKTLHSYLSIWVKWWSSELIITPDINCENGPCFLLHVRSLLSLNDFPPYCPDTASTYPVIPTFFPVVVQDFAWQGQRHRLTTLPLPVDNFSHGVDKSWTSSELSPWPHQSCSRLPHRPGFW